MQNNSTEFSSLSCFKIYNKNGPPDPKSWFLPGFPGFSIGFRLFLNTHVTSRNKKRSLWRRSTFQNIKAVLKPFKTFEMSRITHNHQQSSSWVFGNLHNRKLICYRFGVWGVFFIVNCLKRVAQSLRRIILLHFGLVTFRIHFGKTRKPSFLWFSDLADVTMTPQTNYLQLWRHQLLQVIQEIQEKPDSCWEIVFLNISKFRNI